MNGVGDHIVALFLEGLAVPEPGQGTLLNGFHDLDEEGPSELAATGLQGLPRSHRHRQGLPGDERSVDPAGSLAQHPVGGHNFAVVDPDEVTGLQL